MKNPYPYFLTATDAFNRHCLHCLNGAEQEALSLLLSSAPIDVGEAADPSGIRQLTFAGCLVFYSVEHRRRVLLLDILRASKQAESGELMSKGATLSQVSKRLVRVAIRKKPGFNTGHIEVGGEHEISVSS